MMLRALIVDDHALVRKGFADVLRETGQFVLGEAGTASAALAEARAQPWDVVVLDITLPDESGVRVLEKLSRLRPGLPVLILSMHAEPLYVDACFRLGAAGYVTKEASADELLAAVYQVLRGKRYVGQAVREQNRRWVEFDDDTGQWRLEG